MELTRQQNMSVNNISSRKKENVFWRLWKWISVPWDLHSFQCSCRQLKTGLIFPACQRRHFYCFFVHLRLIIILCRRLSLSGLTGCNWRLKIIGKFRCGPWKCAEYSSSVWDLVLLSFFWLPVSCFNRLFDLLSYSVNHGVSIPEAPPGPLSIYWYIFPTCTFFVCTAFTADSLRRAFISIARGLRILDMGCFRRLLSSV